MDVSRAANHMRPKQVENVAVSTNQVYLNYYECIAQACHLRKRLLKTTKTIENGIKLFIFFYAKNIFKSLILFGLKL